MPGVLPHLFGVGFQVLDRTDDHFVRLSARIGHAKKHGLPRYHLDRRRLEPHPVPVVHPYLDTAIDISHLPRLASDHFWVAMAAGMLTGGEGRYWKQEGGGQRVSQCHGWVPL